MAQGRAFVRFAVFSCGLAWALCGCTGKVTGGDTAAVSQAGTGTETGMTTDAKPKRDAGQSAAIEARAGSSADAGKTAAKEGHDAGAASRASEPQRASEPDHSVKPAESQDAEDAGLACEPLTAARAVSYPKCSQAICPAGDSVCVPGSEVQALGIPFATATTLAQCDNGGKCVATAIVEQAGHVRLPQCTSLAGAEGRCVSSCMPMGAWQPSEFPQDTCSGSDRCAPCYDPRDGRATGACALGCDLGPSEAPRALQKCCSGRGRCLPPQLSGSGDLTLPQDSCEADAVCVPNALTDTRVIPKMCDSVDGAEGRCLSTCLGKLTNLPDLPSEGCERDEVCTPCYDPITGGNTGACDLHGDAPKDPAHRFERCCSEGREQAAGVCVPPSWSRLRTSDLFRRDSCSGGRVCVPTVELTDPDYQYPLCLGVGLGVCMPSCLFDPLNALLFTSLSCDRGAVCVPCSPLIGGCN